MEWASLSHHLFACKSVIHHELSSPLMQNFSLSSIFAAPSPLFFKYKFYHLRRRVMGKKESLPSADSFPKWQAQPGLGQAESRGQEFHSGGRYRNMTALVYYLPMLSERELHLKQSRWKWETAPQLQPMCSHLLKNLVVRVAKAPTKYFTVDSLGSSFSSSTVSFPFATPSVMCSLGNTKFSALF